MVSPNPIACHLIPSGVPTQQLGNGSKMCSTIKGPYRKQTKYIRKHAHFQYLPRGGHGKTSANIHGSSWLSHAFRRVLQFCPWWLPRTKWSHCLEFSSKHGCIPSAPIQTSTPRSSMRLSITLFSEQNVLQMTSQYLEWKVMMTKFWATQLFPFQTFAISFSC